MLVFGLLVPADFGKSVQKSKVSTVIRIRGESFCGHSAVVIEDQSIELVGYKSSTHSVPFSKSHERSCKAENENSKDSTLFDKNIPNKQCSETLKEQDFHESVANDHSVQQSGGCGVEESLNDVDVRKEEVNAINENLKSLITRPCIILHLIGTFFAKYGHMTTYMFIPILGIEIHLSKSQASAMVSMMAAVNIIGRPLMGFLSDCGPCEKCKGVIFALVWGLYGVGVIMLAWSLTFVIMMVNVLLLGVCACEYVLA